MTQIVVNFLQPATVGGALTASSIERRVFDFEITSASQAYYNQELTNILVGLGAQIQDSNGGLHAPTPSTLASGTIVFGGTTNAQAVSDAINLLNNWSKMKQVNAQGFQTYSYGNIGITTDLEGTVVTTDGSGNLINQPAANLRTLTPSNTGVPLTTTMDQYMAQGLDKLIRALRAAGWDPISDPTNTPARLATAQAAIAQVTGTSTASIYGLTGILSSAASAAAQAHLVGAAANTDSMSIQQVLMVDYVSRGNEILFNEMALLKDAVDANQVALSYLNSLQDLMNQKDPQKFIMQLQELNNVNVNTTSPQEQFNAFEKATYDQSLSTLSRLGTESAVAYTAYFNNLATGAPIPADAQLAASAFEDLTNATNTIAGYSVTNILANLDYLIGEIGGKGGSPASGLIQALNTVRNDFQGLSNTPANQLSAIQNWIQDAQPSDQGGFQRNLSNAIVSSQSFNDTERENLREVMFVFEEFYKSASGLLSRLTQLLEKMADGIAR
ncbi:MAG: hypothetical protein JSR37_01415 [Verrucomicrobia bacterium]|nr:hypothetical protein [Verrucomicrobiota bacterium]MBS0636990.1 hypothetical protein [Verrucomicrobiota bacterium]